jgi:hypothetical protein
LISFSRNVVSDQCFTPSGSAGEGGNWP